MEQDDIAEKQAQIDLFDHLDLSDPADNLKALIKTRASLDPTKDVVWYFEGKVYSWVKETNPFANPPARSNKVLFCIRGYNIAKAVPFTQTTPTVAEGYRVLSKDLAFYTDCVTGQPIDCWNNPLNGKTVPVVHIANDPFNLQFNVFSPTFPVPNMEYLGRVIFGVDTLLAFPSVLAPPLAPPGVFTEYSSGNPYQAAELFNYSTNRLEIDFTPLKQTTGEVSWTRLGLPLPWMKMGDSDPGPVWLLYQARGVKLINGFDGLPADIKAKALAEYPGYNVAPSVYTPPPAGAQNSWSVFRTLFESGQYSPTCPAP